MAQRISSSILRLRPHQAIPTSSPTSSTTIKTAIPLSISAQQHKRLYATTSPNPSTSSSDTNSKVQGIGEVGKGDKNARPKILEHAAPVDSADPEVKKHNEEFAKRPDRAVNNGTNKDTAGAAGKDREVGKKA